MPVAPNTYVGDTDITALGDLLILLNCIIIPLEMGDQMTQYLFEQKKGVMTFLSKTFKKRHFLRKHIQIQNEHTENLIF